MEWLSQNWVWLLFAVAMFGMHAFGHGGHGGHGGHSGHGGGTAPQPGGKDSAQRTSEQGSGHHH